MANQETKKLKFFGIGRIIPYLAKMKKLIAVMVFFGLTGSLTDIILPLFQRTTSPTFISFIIFPFVTGRCLTSPGGGASPYR